MSCSSSTPLTNTQANEAIIESILEDMYIIKSFMNAIKKKKILNRLVPDCSK